MSEEQFERIIRFCGFMDDHFRKIASAMEKISGMDNPDDPDECTDFQIMAQGLFSVAEEIQNLNERKAIPAKSKKGKKK